MPIDYNALAIPKGKTRKQLKARKDRQDAKAMRAFQDACWERAACLSLDGEHAHCASCGRIVFRDRPPLGQVHHRVSRRHQGTRHDPANGVILCRQCHNDAHGREF